MSLAASLRAATVASLALVLACSPGCTRARTQLVVVVDTDLVPSTDYRCFGILVSRLGSAGSVEPGATRRFVPAAGGVPFSFGVTPPDGDPRRRVEVAVEALESCSDPGASDRIVRRAVRTGFLPGQTLRLPLFLPRTCGDGCTQAESCPSTGDVCVPVPTTEPEDLTATAPGAEFADAGAAPVDAAARVDTGPPGDAGPPPPCTPVAATGVIATVGDPTSFSLAALGASGGFAVLLDTGSGVSWQTMASNGTDIVGRTPLDTGGTGAWGLVSVNVPGTDDQIIARWRAGISRVDRHVIPAGMADTSSPDLLLGSLVDRGVGCALGTDALVVHDAQGLGVPINLQRIPRTGRAQAIFTDPERRSVDLATRPSGGALLALTGVAPAAADCLVVPVSAAGAAGATARVSVDTTCGRVAITERPDGVVVLAFVHGSPTRAAYQLLDGASLAPMGPIVELGDGQPGRMSATSGSGSTFRITWQDGSGLASRSFEPSGALRSSECITGAGGEYAEHRAAHVGTTTGVAFVTARAISFAPLAD